jgi:hypothetical protein
MGPHLACILMVRAPFQELEDFGGKVSEGLCWNAQGPEGLELADLLLQWLHARRGRLRFESVKRRLRLVRAHHQELVKGCPDRFGEPCAHMRIDVIKKAS